MREGKIIAELQTQIRELERRLQGHAELITLLYGRIKGYETHLPIQPRIPRCYLPVLETKGIPRKPALIAVPRPATRRKRA
jgi:hypothetical protein